MRYAIAAILMVSLLSMANVANAGAKYKTKYKSIGGNPVEAIVEIDGATGSYTLNNGQVGNLSNLKLQDIGGQQILRGNWSLNGVNGTVAWKMDNTFDKMDGTWKKGSQTGYWKGDYEDGSGAIGDMGPVKTP